MSRCRVIPGVSREVPSTFHRGLQGLPTNYCVLVGDVGGMCNSKFCGQCRDALACQADANGNGKKLCRPCRMMGTFCDGSDNMCANGLI